MWFRLVSSTDGSPPRLPVGLRHHTIHTHCHTATIVNRNHRTTTHPSRPVENRLFKIVHKIFFGRHGSAVVSSHYENLNDTQQQQQQPACQHMNLAEPNEQWRESVPFRHGMFGAAKFNHTTELTTPSWRQSRVLFIPSIRLSFYSKRGQGPRLLLCSLWFLPSCPNLLWTTWIFSSSPPITKTCMTHNNSSSSQQQSTCSPLNLAESSEQWRESVPFRHGMFDSAKFHHTTDLTTPPSSVKRR